MRNVATKIRIDRTNSMGLWTYARYYLLAAEKLSQSNEISIPAYYLVSHSIELALKAFLMGSGFPLQKLKNMGHDLEKALRCCDSLGLSSYCNFSDEQKFAIKLINQHYETKELEYIKTGYKQYPQIKLLVTASQTLLGGLKQFCFAQRTTEDKQDI